MNNIANKTVLTIAAIVLIAAFYFGTQFSTQKMIGEDGYFHVRFASQIPERGIPQTLPELRFTIWNQEYRDHHLLFHVLLIPFTKFPDMTAGGKIAAAFFATLACLVFLWALYKFDSRTKWMWVLLFMTGSYAFLFRLQMPRIQSLALIPLIITIVGLCKNKPKTVFAAALLNVWIYDSFILLAIVGTLWVIITQRYVIIGYLLAGLAAGIIINPYFPKNLASYYFNFSRSLAPLGSIPISAEWYPYDSWQILNDAAPAVIVIAIIVAMIAAGKSACRNKTERSFLILTSMVFVALYFKSRRFIEYAFPILLISAAILQRDIWPTISSKKKTAFMLSAVLTMIVGGGRNTYEFISINQADDRYECYMRAGRWINAHIEEGQTIFTTDWDDFPELYFNAPKVRYVAGLDPLFIKLYNNDLYDLYIDITTGREKKPYAQLIKSRFDSRYIFTDTDHSAFITKFDNERGVFRVFSEPSCRIYQIAEKN